MCNDARQFVERRQDRVSFSCQPLAASKDLLDLIQDGVYCADDQGHYTYANPAALRQVGYSLDELTRLGIPDLVCPEQVHLLPGHLARMNAGELLSSEWVLVRKDGSHLHTELSTRRLPAGGYLAIARDIGERKRAEAVLLEQQAIYRAIVETPAAGFWLADTTGRLLEVNDYYARLTGYSRTELLTMRITDLEAKESAAETAVHIEAIMRRGYDRFRTLHRHKDGRILPVEIVTTLRLDIAGGRFFVFIEDIADKVRREEQLQIAATVLETMDQAVVVTDADNRIVAVNPALTHITGYTLDELRGKDPKIFASGRHDKDFYRAMWRALAADGHWEGEIWDRKKSGEIYAKWLTINVLRDADGNIGQYISVFADITEKKRSEELIWHQANFCPLTDLPNRRMFTDRLEQEIKKSQRSGERFALLYLDLDHFKEINDTLGHSMGDELLREAARRLAACVRETDTVARLGGDEFTLLLPALRSGDTVERIVQTILHAFAQSFQLGGEEIYVTPSIGVTLFPEDAADAESLLKNADQAMYAAKQQGRNGHHYYTPGMQEQARFRMRQLRDLRSALANGEFRVYYQPIVDLANRRIHKAEALVRWQHPERGLLAPGEFIALAEESGMIVDIGNWVFDAAARQARQWRERFQPAFQISVNKSPVQFRHDAAGHADWLERLHAVGLPGDGVVIEITETALMENSQTIEDKLLGLRERGIQVALDDFGTGYSSLAYLRRFDIDYVKIDQSFVRNMSAGSDDLALCEAIIVMAHRLGIKVVAEGVETRQQYELLRAAGCDYAQGYLFSRPVPAEIFERLLNDGPPG
jgi:diguanylate cyclase (GGDEF)-like protein/PAS domain S-box-containing protein